MDVFKTPFGTYQLQRQPIIHNDPLRAWDAADELLLQHLAEQNLPMPGASILIVNDQFAALSCVLHSYALTVYSDSWLSRKALIHNFEWNRLTPVPTFLPGTASPASTVDLVLIKIPKSLALLEHQLIALQYALKPDTRIIASGMVKYLHKNHIALFDRYLGPTSTSLARKKARLIFAQWQQTEKAVSPYPTQYQDALTGLQLSNHANVFSRERLDNGSRLLLQHRNKLPRAKHIIDIGCGNGILGIAARQYWLQQDQEHDPTAVTFADESFMALQSARDNYRRAFGSLDKAEFIASDAFDELPNHQADLVLCNPPFHQSNTIGDHIAWKMITGAQKALWPGGHFWLVGNRHLNYHAKLKKVFGNCTVSASNEKFVVLEAAKK